MTTKSYYNDYDEPENGDDLIDTPELSEIRETHEQVDECDFERKYEELTAQSDGLWNIISSHIERGVILNKLNADFDKSKLFKFLLEINAVSNEFTDISKKINNSRKKSEDDEKDKSDEIICQENKPKTN